jgi:GTPase Era involved in 16S rRNA processing
MNYYSRALLPQFAIVTNEDITIDLFDNRFFAIIRDNSQVEKAIFSYIWEKDCYFNQRGCLIDELSPKNLSFDEISSTTSLNIMLTGMSGAGKSTLINVLSKKFVALETLNPESVTTEINEYIIYKKIGDYKVRFKFIDTPGLIVDKKINTIDLLKDLITKKLKEYDDSNDSIHIIYFMTAAIPNFESIKPFFQFLDNLNDERKKNNKPTIPILFINNRNTGTSDLDGIRQFLKNNYKSLYQSFKKEENKPLSFQEKFKKKNKENEIKDNVLGVNLLKDKDENGDESKIFGINRILIATKNMIKQTNPFNEEDFRQLEELVNFIK